MNDNEICDYSLLYRYECAHCTGADDSDLVPDHEYEITSNFPSQYNGYCTLNDAHRIRKGERVSKLRMSDNPLISVPGVACSVCSLDIPRAKS